VSDGFLGLQSSVVELMPQFANANGTRPEPLAALPVRGS
jgi:hypothetical protein